MVGVSGQRGGSEGARLEVRVDFQVFVFGEGRPRAMEEAPAERFGLSALSVRAGGLVVANAGGQPRGVSTVDAVELPGDGRGALDQEALGLVPGL
jgi:hypothetical protein